MHMPLPFYLNKTDTYYFFRRYELTVAQLRGGDLQGLSGNYGTGDGGGGIFGGHGELT